MEEEAIIGDVGNRGKFGVQAQREVTAHCLSGFLGTIRGWQGNAVETHLQEPAITLRFILFCLILFETESQYDALAGLRIAV